MLFALVFVAWAAFRAYNPEIAGTEKPMEFAFINGVLGSRFFPPQDPWLSGYAISYYYFGYIMLGLLIRLTGVDPAVGFNLGVALWYALVMVGAFGVVYELVMLGRRTTDDRRRTTDDAPETEDDDPSRHHASRSRIPGMGRGIGFGLLGALFVGFIGNLEGVIDSALPARARAACLDQVARHKATDGHAADGQLDRRVLVVVARLACDP